jgi:leader peptidase (prepilin peptidase)/N-methyltransferase
MRAVFLASWFVGGVVGSSGAFEALVLARRGAWRRGWRPRRARRWREAAWFLVGASGLDAVWLVEPTWAARLTGLLAAWVAFVAAVVDVRTHRIPRRLVELAGLGEVVLWGALGAEPLRDALAALVGASEAVAAWWLLRLVSRGGVGLGDVVLAGALAAALAPLGWWTPLALGIVALSVGALGGLARLARGGSLRDVVPFAPALGLALLVSEVGLGLLHRHLGLGSLA